MTRPCCYDGRDCQNMTTPEQFAWCRDRGGKLGPVGTCCNDSTTGPDCSDVGGNPCWVCEYDVGGFDYGSCCFHDLDFQWFESIKGGQCTSCGGEPHVLEGDCQPGPREQECIYAGEDREAYPGAPRWTLDTIGTVVFGLAKVTETPESGWPPHWTEEGWPADWPEGYHYGLTTHLARPREPETPENACGHAVGRFTMLDDGYVYMETCSLPDVNNLDSHRRSYGELRTFDESDEQQGIKAGYQYWVTCIRTPWWTEALYRSHQQRCRATET